MKRKLEIESDEALTLALELENLMGRSLTDPVLYALRVGLQEQRRQATARAASSVEPSQAVDDPSRPPE